MPVTAKLSKRFYDRFGHEITNEFVDWFNQVDATYRSDLKDINELNFARFDAKVEQRFAQFEARFAQFESKWEQRFAQFESKWEQRLAQFEAKWEQRFADLRTDLGSRIDKLAVEAAEGRTAQTRWMFVAWATLLIPIIGLWTR